MIVNRFPNPMVVAEIGCNHKGSMDIALEMARVAVEYCGVDIVKFQKRTPKLMLTEEEYNAPHPNPSASYGETYGEHREVLELSKEEHLRLHMEIEKMHALYSSSVWDMQAAEDIKSIGAHLVKIPSAKNTDSELIKYCLENFARVHISTGMTTERELYDLADLINPFMDKVAVYSCVSAYPVPHNEARLLDVERIKSVFEGHRIGLSGHHLGIALDVAAYALGAQYFERHFTLDRSWKGTDHAASLEPDAMRKLVRDLKAVKTAMKKKAGVCPIEEPQRIKLKRGNK